MAANETKFFIRDEDGFTLVTISARDQLKSQRLTVTSTATSLPGSGGLSKRRFLFIKNVEDPEEVVYIGGSGVTSDEGFPIKRGEILQLDVAADVTVKGIVAANSAEVAILEVN